MWIGGVLFSSPAWYFQSSRGFRCRFQLSLFEGSVSDIFWRDVTLRSVYSIIRWQTTNWHASNRSMFSFPSVLWERAEIIEVEIGLLKWIFGYRLSSSTCSLGVTVYSYKVEKKEQNIIYSSIKRNIIHCNWHQIPMVTLLVESSHPTLTKYSLQEVFSPYLFLVNSEK